MRELGYALHLGTTDPDRIQQRVDAITSTGAPLLADVTPYLATSDHDAEFHYGLELLIAGLAARTVGRVGPQIRARRPPNSLSICARCAASIC